MNFRVVVRGLDRGLGARVAERIRERLERLGAVSRRGKRLRLGGAADDGTDGFSLGDGFGFDERDDALLRGDDDGGRS